MLFEGFLENIELKRQALRNKAKKVHDGIAILY